MISQDKIAQVRDRASIVEIISDHLTLKKAGRNYVGLCPFHGESTPSFTVSEEKGIFHCFGCQVGGNVFNFLMRLESLTFPEAVERVGKRYGIVVERTVAPWKQKQADQKESLFRLNEQVAAYYHRMLFASGEARAAAQYLKSRGIKESTARSFCLGYAPRGGQALVEWLKQERVPLEGALRLGLIGERRPGLYGDKFAGRLIFPIIDAMGKVAGFGGRVIEEGMPKYLNSAESAVFQKRSTLYGLSQGKEAIRKADRVVVVEGYVDVLALTQFGIGYVVATLGTALTPDHVRTLGRYTKNIIALFDGDEAGRKAAARGFEIFVEGGVLGRAAFLPQGEDPDTYVRAQGKEALEKIIDDAVPLADYYFSWLVQTWGTSLEGKSRTAQEINRVLGKVKNSFEVDLLARRAADSLGIREELLRIPARTPGQRSSGPVPPLKHGAPAETKGDDLAERSLIRLMLQFPNIIQAVQSLDEPAQFFTPKWKDIVQTMIAAWRQDEQADVARMAQALPPEQAARLTALALDGENTSEAEAQKMAQDCLCYLQKRQLGVLEKSLRQAIRIAEERRDEEVKKERMLEWQEVVRKKGLIERREI
jgi:DNA primase